MLIINEAASLIREFNPRLADAFIAQPFNRVALAKAFRAGFKAQSVYSEKVCQFVETVARRDQLERA